MAIDLEPDEIKLAKYYLSTNLYQFTIFYSRNYDILFNYSNQMAVASDDLKIFASQMIQKDEDFQYESVSMYEHDSGDLVGVYEGNRIRIAILLRPQANIDVVLNNIDSIIQEFSDAFEGKYRKELKDYENYNGSFDDIQEIINKTFILDLALPHSSHYMGFDMEDKLDQYIYAAAEEFSRNVGYFYLDNLLYLTKQHVIDEARNILMSDPARAKREKINPDKIEFPLDEKFFISMFNMRKLGMLRPIAINELNQFSKIKY